MEKFLDAASAGDQMAARHALSQGAAVSLGNDTPIAAGELVAGGRWATSIAAGDTVSASVTTPSGRCVIFWEIPSATTGITRIRYFASL